MDIIRPITSDQLVGYDSHGQLIHITAESDGSKVMRFIKDVRYDTCIICNHGWEHTGPSMGDQLNWNLLDTQVHRTCYVRYQGLLERSHFSSILNSIPNLRYKNIRTIPNGYWPESDPFAAKPWYEVELLDYPAKFIIGTRKRVTHIEVSPIVPFDIKLVEDTEFLFKDENVTKGFSSLSCYAHSHDNKSDVIYLSHLCKGLQLDRKVTPDAT